MPKLFLLRHLKSQWNLENRFTGWTDVPLSKEGIESAKNVSEKISGAGIDKVYTSPLIRNKESVFLILKNLNKENLPIIINKALNERNYGKLQGLNKDEVKKQYGNEQVKAWRRSWDQAPLEGESLKDVFERVIPFFQEYIENDLRSGKNILVVSSHNSLRAIVKYMEDISDEEIINLEIPYAGLIIYDLDKDLKIIKKKTV
ncbi:MAG: 2,3-diphosphoglycerate-dependent phosphoglycerate mutase [Patescibacteria group bacterium]|nr:2,3-diphosphoglycerate-dependent phosphoglycerate mutase [Patescibacteria group bacterium]MBU1877075.1 2,3-diphosphoglycerate-dependent phosphoglycerate mutase [Patescibacteria group bacterium]